MSLVSLLFNTRAPQSAQIAAFTMDVTIREEHERSAGITTFPVERGSRISDNRVTEPARLVIEGFVSSAPLGLFPFAQGALGFTRIKNAFDALIELHERQDVFQVITGYTIYDNMQIVNLSLPRERAEGLRFTAEFQQLDIVDSELIEFTRPSPTIADQAAPTTNAGKQATQEASTQTSDQGSFLFNLSRRLF